MFRDNCGIQKDDPMKGGGGERQSRVGMREGWYVW